MAQSPEGPVNVAIPSGTETLSQLVERFSTPLVVHDRAVLRERAAALRTALPAGSVLLYSLKANPLPAVVTALREAGCGTEVSSPAELRTALDPSGPQPGSSPVLYTGPGKTDPELRAALAAGAVLSCESAAEVARARALHDPARPLPVMLRVQPPGGSGAGLSMAGGRQFGLLEDDARRLARDPGDGVEITGLHVYLGSQLPTCEALLEAFGQAVSVVRRVAEAGRMRPAVVDLGGGFPWPYATAGQGPDLAPLTDGLTELVRPLREQGTEIWFESGRGLVAAAGRLLTTVLDVKDRGGATVVVVDAGVNVLGGMSGLGRVLRPATGFRNLTRPGGDPVRADVVGPLCTPLDKLAAGAAVPEPRVGDLLCVDNAGAYATTAALSSFLSRPAAVEVMVDGGELVGAWALRTGHERVDRGHSASTRKPM